MTKMTEGVTRTVLANGLTVLVKENHTSPVAAIYTHVKAGYFNEADEVVGISHLIEHMFFKGTARRGAGEIAKETKELGGTLNAATIYDHTVYYTLLPSKHFAQGLDLQADALIHPAFDPGELEKETEVVIEEAKRKLDTPAAVAREKLFELAFQQHRIRRWRIGTEDGLRTLLRTDFLTFHRNLYRPENIILAVVGDIKTDKAIRQIEHYYGSFSRGTLIKEGSPHEPAQTALRFRQLRGNIQQAYLTFGFHTPAISEKDSYALEVLGIILGHGKSSRLFQQVKEGAGLVKVISADNYALQDIGIFLIGAVARPDTLRAGELAVAKEVQTILHNPVSAGEISKAQNLLRSSYMFGLETMAGQAGTLANYEALGSYNMVDETMQELLHVDATRIMKVAERYLTPENMSILEYVPKEAQLAELPPEEMASRLTREIRPTPSLAKRAPDGSSRTMPTILPSIIALNREPESRLLSNGIKLLVRENHEVPVVSTGIFVLGGRSRETTQNAGISNLMSQSALRGTTERSAVDIAAEIENIGATLSFSSEPDYFSCTMNTVAQHSETGWDVLADVMSNPVFSVSEVKKEKDDVLARIERLRDDMFRYPLLQFFKLVFKNHAYGLPSLGTPESLDDLTQEDLYGWHARHIRGDQLLVTVVGDVEPDRVAELVESKLGALARAAAHSETGRPAPRQSSGRFMQETKKKQSGLVLGFTGPGYSDKNYYALRVLQNILSGLSGRLFEKLRSRQSLAYTVSAFLVARKLGGTFLSYIATSPQKEEIARASLLRELNQLTEVKIPREELERAIRYTIGTHEIGLETNRAQMAQMAHSELLGKGWREAWRFPKKIACVTSDNILNAARAFFDPHQYCEVLIRGKKTTVHNENCGS